MTGAIPKPLSAAIGLLPTVLATARRLPTRAVQLPILVLSSALTGLDVAKREYEELAERENRLRAAARHSTNTRVPAAAAGPRKDIQ